MTTGLKRVLCSHDSALQSGAPCQGHEKHIPSLTPVGDKRGRSADWALATFQTVASWALRSQGKGGKGVHNKIQPQQLHGLERLLFVDGRPNEG